MTTAGTKERVRLQAAFKKSTVFLHCFPALAGAVKTETGQQGDQTHRTCRDQRVLQKLIDQARIRGRDWRYRALRKLWGRHWIRRFWRRYRGYRSSYGIVRRGGGADGRRNRRNRRNRRCRRSRHYGRHGRYRHHRWGQRRCAGGCHGHWYCRTGSSPNFAEVADIFGKLGCFAGRVFGGALFGNSVGIGLRLHCALGQSQFVGCGGAWLPVIHAGLHAAAGLTVGRRHLRSRGATRQFFAEIVKVPALRNHHPGGFCRASRLGLLCGWHVDKCAALDAVDVVIDECIRVGTQQGDKHLIQ